MQAASAIRSEAVSIRRPRVGDGKAIWKLVHDTGVLDLNSPYCYLLLCLHNRDTCALAEYQGRIVAFVSGYLLPDRSDTLFIWQIGVDSAWRGKGLGTRLLLELLERESCNEIAYLEATVEPANQASRALFNLLAKRLKTKISERALFDPANFPDQHGAENLLRIGPFSPSQLLSSLTQGIDHAHI